MCVCVCVSVGPRVRLYRRFQANVLRQTLVIVQQLFKLLLQLGQLLVLCRHLQPGLSAQTVVLQLLLCRLNAGGRPGRVGVREMRWRFVMN